MPAVKLKWSSAQVEDARLTVELEGDPPKGWKQSFETTAKLLDNGSWGEVKLKKGTVRVDDLGEADPEKLRHYLESVVEQANATTGAEAEDEDEDEDDESEARDDEDESQSRDDGGDSEMTERFRSFGESD
jgi:hypothetical protein